eukprot:TRINITY_DN95524_c0_g1_i1.p1 TRINITY_DN95524_c0_g1~~TRINITY_DN95524_c0_g1_i1.p1  ORF type:complete len:161 (+),score=28.77 TRINITY_DN95524_c0_g1_i1:53-535(+)
MFPPMAQVSRKRCSSGAMRFAAACLTLTIAFQGVTAFAALGASQGLRARSDKEYRPAAEKAGKLPATAAVASTRPSSPSWFGSMAAVAVAVGIVLTGASQEAWAVKLAMPSDDDCPDCKVKPIPSASQAAQGGFAATTSAPSSTTTPDKTPAATPSPGSK